ncbi:hypothetical protein AQJ43_05120 [Streptomyces avermitilis]|uniref:Secreted protein n=2 Tax=Streptomyces avermitilis TaxID=33903 RepID=Q82GT4_STRAW|nr:MULTISPECIES: hypothetical protein [Streptomyces]KUN56946.1 hypothetical protein AQJ43_05120 [Streptomyces avermitilis]MYS99410.1 hypothetical protein [Streptomyces sp. SID5469]OOV32326.1 hypothetical protein SM007_05610 [Streptomyces avermitilis]BAC71524.1 putative secreted protein [Streptomyces avermitilis MA-4680 = NBRC 14893]BBJ51751.1 hypothetical protein SAVMC3_43800 [Streptomyces avermitilis]
MYTRGRTLKFAAVLTMVVLALTGFSRGRGHGGHGGHSGGGGCSSSSQNHDSSSSSTSGGGSYSSGSTTSGAGSDDSYDDSYGDSDDDSYSSGSSSSGSSGGSTYNRRPTHRSNPTSSSGDGDDEPLKDGTARVVSCATKKAPYATVEVKNPNARKGTFWITVTFKDKDGLEIVDHYADVRVPAKGKATVDVEVGGAGLVDYVDHCDVDPVAESSS